MAELLNSVTGDTVGDGVSHVSPASVFVTGEFGGATVTTQVSADGTNWVKADNVSLRSTSRMAAPGVCNIDAHGEYHVRCVVSGAGPETNISATSTS